MRDAHTQVDYQARFEELQARFIDEPREAVQEATTLVREAVDHLFKGEQDTERLRRLMQGYRDLLGRLDGHQVAATSRGSEAAYPERPAAVREHVRDEEAPTEPAEQVESRERRGD